MIGNDSIKNATSVLDYIFRELGVSYLGRTDLAHVVPASDEDIGDGGDGGGASEVAIAKVASSGYLRGYLKQVALLVKGGAAPRMLEEHDHFHVQDGEFDSEEEAVDLSEIRASVEAQLASANPVGEQMASLEAALVSRQSAKEAHARRVAEARMKGFEGDSCGACGNFTLVRNGTCMKCNTCGSTSGCS